MSSSMISIASRQVWPQILSVLHFKPQKLTLLHSRDDRESKEPAQRLKAFFEKHKLVEMVSMRAISHTRIEDLSALKPEPDTLLNLTGGNKLMSFSLYNLGLKDSCKMFYLERNNQIVWLNSSSPSQKIDSVIIDSFDPADLIECQLSASRIERKGEFLTLTSGKLEVKEKLPKEEEKKGDELEFETAEQILKLGIKSVRRSLRLKPKTFIPDTKPHNEIDLVFVWKGKLWIVDCKDRVSPGKLMSNLKGERALLGNIASQLKQNRTHNIKDDLVAVSETGGLMGKAICVWKEDMPPEILSYASHLGVEFIRKDMLKEGLERILAKSW